MALDRSICPPCTVDLTAGNEDWRIALRDFDRRRDAGLIPMDEHGHPASPFPEGFKQWLRDHLCAMDYTEVQ